MEPSAAFLARFGIDRTALIGEGGQSLVYALDGARILRVLRRPEPPSALERLQRFLAGIDGRLPYGTSAIETIDPAGRFTIERRLRGRPLLALLSELSGDARRMALSRYADGAEAIGQVRFEGSPYGHLLATDPIVAPTWRGFLAESVDRAVAANAATLADTLGTVEPVRAAALALLDRLPEHPPKSLVHGDYFPGNVLLDDGLVVSGLVDFSVFTCVGDPSLDTVGFAIVLEMVEAASPADIAFVRDRVLARHGERARVDGAFYRAWFALSMANPAWSAGPYPGLFRWSLANLRAVATHEVGF